MTSIKPMGCLVLSSLAFVLPLASAQQPHISKPDLLWNKLQNAIIEQDMKFDGILGVAILDLTSGKLLLHNGDDIFPAASSIKIAVLAELFRQSEQSNNGMTGKAKLADTYTVDAKDLAPSSPIMAGLTIGVTQLTNRDLATLMIVVSDNAAANVLIDRLGMANINGLLEGLGLKEMRMRRKLMDVKAAAEGRENTATPREMVQLQEALFRNKVLSKATTGDLFKLLSTPKESYIPRYLPANVVVANKPGSLTAVRTDSGILFVKNRPFALSVMTTYARDERAAEDVIGHVALSAYQLFELQGRASELGRVIEE